MIHFLALERNRLFLYFNKKWKGETILWKLQQLNISEKKIILAITIYITISLPKFKKRALNYLRVRITISLTLI